MKNFRILLALILLALTACENDGDIITTDGADAVTLSGSGDAVLSAESTDALALTLYWTDNSRLTTSDSRVQTPIGTIVNTLEFAAAEDFSDIVSEQTDAGTTSKQYTAEALNSIVGRLGLEANTPHPLYIRISSVLAENMPTQYSNTYIINVTPYEIDRTTGYVLNADKSDSGSRLAARNGDGIYAGFQGVGAWYNWWLQEGDGTLWGNIGDDGGGKPFIISSNEQHWNFWYPGQSGCYYTTVNTQKQEWTALYIPSLTVSGDIEGQMEYNRKANAWTLTFNAQKAGSATIQIAGTGALYNSSTGTDDATAVSTPACFGQDGDEITFGTSASDINVEIPATGTATLSLDLINPLEWTCTVKEGAGESEPTAAASLWAVGIDDGTTGGWNFDQQLFLTDEDALRYVGLCNVNSLWGYRLYTEKDVWDNYYALNSGDALNGTLLKGSENNLPAPDAGLYLIDVGLNALSYALTAVQSVQITGINDDWNLTQMTQSTDDPCVFTAQVSVSASTPWGFKVLLNENWDTYFGGTSGAMVYQGENIPFDDGLIGSTITVSVDFRNNSISFE